MDNTKALHGLFIFAVQNECVLIIGVGLCVLLGYQVWDTSEQVMLKFPTLHYYINSFWGSKLTIGLVYENICRCEL